MAGHINTANNQQWNTPKDLVELITNFFCGDIHLDPCSNDSSLVKAIVEFKLPQINGLEQDWLPYSTVFLNPPFQRVYIRKSNLEMVDPKVFKELISTKQAKREDFHIYTINDWIHKSIKTFNESKYGNSKFLLLIPAAVGTKPWQNLIFKQYHSNKPNTGICFINGRVTFDKAPGPCPMAMALVYLGIYKDRFVQTFSPLGYCL